MGAERAGRLTERRPLRAGDRCPSGTYYGTFQGVTQCWSPDPNQENPEYPPNEQNPDPDPEDPEDPPGSGGDFDDSRIVSRLDQIKSRIDTTNEHLSNANESLGDIKDAVTADAPAVGSSVFDFSVTDAKRAEVTAEFNAAFEAIRAEAATLFQVAVNGAGGLTDEIKTVKGVDVAFGWTRFAPHLSMIGAIIVAVAYVLALVILMRK